MTGISEILVLILLITLVLILPRMVKPASQRRGKPAKPQASSKKQRAGILVSFIWPLLLAGLLRPWEGSWLLFAGAGILPVFLAWGIFWVASAPKK
ncbi:MAG: hypothetical protein MI749_04665 [Desulfovibrionales bacterium]|nr:hypothetical protein [Desulfovibrionales bacterium]